MALTQSRLRGARDITTVYTLILDGDVDCRTRNSDNCHVPAFEEPCKWVWSPGGGAPAGCYCKYLIKYLYQ